MGDATTTEEAADGPPFPTYAERLAQTGRAPRTSWAYERLIWPIAGGFPSAIAVMKKPQRNTGDADPLFDPKTGEWHEIASHSITQEKVSAIKASLANLDHWSGEWGDYHTEHADPENPQCEYATYGDLSDDDRPFADDPMREDGTWDWEMDSDTEFLVRCCGQDRPLGKAGRTLEVRPSEGNDFVTIKDYVGAVHPWLMSMRDDIIGAMATAEPGCPPCAEWKLSTSYHDAPQHRIDHPENWDSQNHSPQNLW